MQDGNTQNETTEPMEVPDASTATTQMKENDVGSSSPAPVSSPAPTSSPASVSATPSENGDAMDEASDQSNQGSSSERPISHRRKPLSYRRNNHASTNVCQAVGCTSQVKQRHLCAMHQKRKERGMRIDVKSGGQICHDSLYKDRDQYRSNDGQTNQNTATNLKEWARKQLPVVDSLLATSDGSPELVLTAENLNFYFIWTLKDEGLQVTIESDGNEGLYANFVMGETDYSERLHPSIPLISVDQFHQLPDLIVQRESGQWVYNVRCYPMGPCRNRLILDQNLTLVYPSDGEKTDEEILPEEDMASIKEEDNREKEKNEREKKVKEVDTRHFPPTPREFLLQWFHDHPNARSTPPKISDMIISHYKIDRETFKQIHAAVRRSLRDSAEEDEEAAYVPIVTYESDEEEVMENPWRIRGNLMENQTKAKPLERKGGRFGNCAWCRSANPSGKFWRRGIDGTTNFCNTCGIRWFRFAQKHKVPSGIDYTGTELYKLMTNCLFAPLYNVSREQLPPCLYKTLSNVSKRKGQQTVFDDNQSFNFLKLQNFSSPKPGSYTWPIGSCETLTAESEASSGDTIPPQPYRKDPQTSFILLLLVFSSSVAADLVPDECIDRVSGVNLSFDLELDQMICEGRWLPSLWDLLIMEALSREPTLAQLPCTWRAPIAQARVLRLAYRVI
ncbi:hypothetical protein PROFUN_02998 [Planoprotostelium fungivorum]|uniref:GATA-type domain-containing protein n=1 Tax=Planoprotostelium fungivorum TaxID=1890364 RepID=A0A2P6NXB1_9EUKA|nr:hypothetical protein PROFUN_02998 [Planoprotostelium fungivorum]